MMEYFVDSLSDVSRLNVIYTVLLVATATSLKFPNPEEFLHIVGISFNKTTLLMATETSLSYESIALGIESTQANQPKPSLIIRLAQRLGILLGYACAHIQNQFNEHTATSVASLSVLIIVLSIICCFIISLMREEERRIKEQYKKLNTGSSQSFIAINGQYEYRKIATAAAGQRGQQILASHSAINGQPFVGPGAGGGGLVLPASHRPGGAKAKIHLVELRRETYFGLVRLLKPGCRTIVLLCESQSRLKLLTKFYQCIYPYRKNKTLQFAFLLIEKNIGWYKELLKLALNEKRDLHINPINCIGTVLVLNGFKKYFSVYHASDSRQDLDEPLVLLEESLLDGFPDWLERLFLGKINRYYVKYWPNQMK